MRQLISYLFVIIFLFLANPSSAGLEDFDVSKSQVELNSFLSGGPAKDGIPSLTNPKFISASEATYLRNDDLVVGIIREGMAKAYPIAILNWHEIINDEVAGTPVAVTWCPLTRSAVSFDRRVESETLEFGVSGLLYNSNVVMYDRNSDGLWSQLKSEALTGKHSSKELKLLPSLVVSWGQWRSDYPDTLVVSNKTGHLRNYKQDPYAFYHLNNEVMFPLEKTDKRLSSKSIVLGIKLNGMAKAYPYQMISKLDKPLIDEFQDTQLKITSVEGGGAIVEDSHGKVIPSVVAYWFAWSTFNQETELFQK